MLNLFRAFQGSLSDAEKISRDVERFIVFFVEQDLEEDISISGESLAYRAAFADNELANFINQKVIAVFCSFPLASVTWPLSVRVHGGLLFAPFQQASHKAGSRR